MPAGKKSGKKRSDKQVSDYLTGLIGSTKDLLDDLVEQAGEVEKKARANGKRATQAVVPSKKSVESVRDQIKDLRKQARKLAKLGK